MSAWQVKKPMRVTFFSSGVMEEGVDQGGVTKEFFQLVTRALFNEVWPGSCPASLLCTPEQHPRRPAESSV